MLFIYDGGFVLGGFCPGGFCPTLHQAFPKQALFSRVCSTSLELNLYHTIPTFNDPKEQGFEKHYRKRRKCW